MKTLFITLEGHKQRLDALYLAFHKAVGSCDFRDLNAEQRKDLRWYFETFVKKDRFDRIIIHLDFEDLDSQVKFLKTVPNLVLIDFHVNKASVNSTAHLNRYKKFLRQLPWARLIVSSFTLAERLRDDGFDVWALAKGYDDSKFVDYQIERDVLTGFIGSRASVSYEIRKDILAKIQDVFPQHYHGEDLDRSEFVMKLNHIKYFINPDKNLNEYTHRYFEAMACGAIILGVDQGRIENEALGFYDMKNIVFAETPTEFKQKVQLLEKNPKLVDAIRREAKQLVQRKYTFEKTGLSLFKLVDMRLRDPAEYESALNIFGIRF